MQTGDRLFCNCDLYRRAYRNQVDQTGEATSRAFTLRKNKNEKELSVDIAKLTTPEKSVIDPERFVLFKIANEVIINNDLKTIYDPIKDDSTLPDNEAHALIEGLDPEDEIKPGILARNSKRVWITQ